MKTIYNSVADFKNNHPVQNNHVIFTGFRPSSPKWSDQSIWFTLGHMLQIQKLKNLATLTKWETYCIIADCQWYGDFATAQHAHTIRDLRQSYIRELLKTIDLNSQPIKIFLESDVRRNIDSLKWLLEYHINANDFLEYIKEKEKARENLWKVNSGSLGKLIGTIVGQSSQLLWAQTTIVPSWKDQTQATTIAADLAMLLNNEFWLNLAAPIAIAEETYILWIDWQVMSTNKGNALTTLQTSSDIKNNLNQMSEDVLLHYHQQFTQAWATLSKVFDRTELIDFIVNILSIEHSNPSSKSILHHGAQHYRKSITAVEDKIHSAIFWT